MRSWATFIGIIVFCAIFSLYINVAFRKEPIIAPYKCKLLFYSNLVWFTVLMLYNQLKPSLEPYFNQVCSICITTLIINFTIPLLYYAGVICSAAKLIMSFNGLVIVVSLIIYITGARHGYYKS